ncbi:MAG: hypothetical protein KAS38_03860, partial [Anaerolineales bacterium]|nr:hypothetical protein [Anaerolineales bacterium]
QSLPSHRTWWRRPQELDRPFLPPLPSSSGCSRRLTSRVQPRGAAGKFHETDWVIKMLFSTPFLPGEARSAAAGVGRR